MLMKMHNNNNNNEPNPPLWPTDGSVVLMNAGNAEKLLQHVQQDPWDEKHETHTSEHHFDSQRQVVLVAPGVYDRNITFQVGYYTQVLGLGRAPTDVLFQGKGPYVDALNRHLHGNHRSGTCLDSFWRAAEGFATDGDLHWAVSQAAPLRRVHVNGDLYLHDGEAYASGGFVANSVVQGRLRAGGQQQYLIRNVDLTNGATGGAWSMVYVGCTGQVPVKHAGNGTFPAVTVLSKPWLRLEKPYLIQIKSTATEPSSTNPASYALVVPQVRLPETNDATKLLGVQFDHDVATEERDFARVRVVQTNEAEAQDRVQEALDQGKDVVLAPGILRLTKSLILRHPNQVLMGLGLATLVNPLDGSPCIRVHANVPGIRVAGVMLEASETKSTTCLLQWGDKNITDEGEANNPGGLFDVFVRVGGPLSTDRKAICVETMIQLYSGNIVGDNLWLWRADHSELTKGEKANYPHISPLYWQSEEGEFVVETGLQVLGNNITMYGLAVEHANGHQTQWKGQHGRVAFYQCELPYGVSQQTFGDPGYTGYLVDDQVTHHDLLAPGIYSNFRNGPVHTMTAIRHPSSAAINVVNPFTVWLDNHFGIQSIINGQGDSTDSSGAPARMPIHNANNNSHVPMNPVNQRES